MGCSWHASSLKNIVNYSIFVGFSRCFSNRITYAFGCLLLLSWAVFWAFLGCLLVSLGPLGLPLWALLGFSWTHLGPFWSLLGPVLAHPGEILASSRPSWAILGLQQAFFEFSGSTMIASSLSRSLLGGVWGLLKPSRGCIWSFSAQSKTSLGPPGRLMGSARAFFGAASGASSAILGIARKLLETARHLR